jgi:hypothetical protein
VEAIEALTIIVHQVEGELCDHGNLYEEEDREAIRGALAWANEALEQAKKYSPREA